MYYRSQLSNKLGSCAHSQNALLSDTTPQSISFKNSTQLLNVSQSKENSALGTTTLVAFNALNDTLDQYSGLKGEIGTIIHEFDNQLKQKETLMQQATATFESKVADFI
jgi:hypothetical protein